MKNPFRNIFNYFKNKLQKPNKNNNEATKFETEETTTEQEVNEIKQPTTEQEENKIKEPMSEEEAKTRRNNLLIDFDNNFNSYNKSDMFSSIAKIKFSTERMIDEHYRSDYSDIGENYINFAKYFIVKKLMARKDFELPKFNEYELDITFSNQGIDEKQNNDTHIRLIKTEIYKKRNSEMEELIKDNYKEPKKAEELLNEYYGYNVKDFKNTEEGSRDNTPKASIIPKFIYKTAIATLSQ